MLNYASEKIPERLKVNGGKINASQLPAQVADIVGSARRSSLGANAPKAELLANSMGGADKIRFPDQASVDIAFDKLRGRSDLDPQKIDLCAQIAKPYAREPDKFGDAGGTGGDAGTVWVQVQAQVEGLVKAKVQEIKKTLRMPMPAGIGTPIQQGASSSWRLVTAQGAGPLPAGPYESMEQLKSDLIARGPVKETYAWLDGLLGNGHKRAKDAQEALADFYQGVASALCVLYDILVQDGKANAIDTEIVGRIMEQHPELNKEEPKTADLQIPACMTKTASGGTGGAGSGYPAYVMNGPGENKMCPKIRQPVSEFICRFHCVQGLVVDNAAVVCGEAIWRQAVMDKFSREYRDAEGNWKGGYINKRFEVHRDDGGHPYQLKPGTRRHPIHESAWSIEKRLQEMRRAESDKRGYCETPGDPKGLYNFDQHELVEGNPKNPNSPKSRRTNWQRSHP